jgi:hypothetical protein
VAIGVSALTVFAAYVASSQAVGDPSDPGVADIAFFISPIFAAGAAMVTGLLLVSVALLRLVDLTVGDAVLALGIGIFGGPLLYLIVLIASASALDAAKSIEVYAFVSFMVPVLCGIGVTLISALVRRK